ncbi:MAG TPA: serine/threonine-protein kinase [Solirubrobacteraceae bacterium]|jgi:serine/threonine-protein kinase|nr:serine/threonine-protein kinase [Solirubrobacteraceae bacterium]
MDSSQGSTVVAGYRIDGTLGEGGMGTVYRATQLSLERVVALKVLTAELSADPGFRERFRREGLLQAALDHPHIVTVYEAGEANERLFLAMRMVEGPTLKDLIQRHELDDRRALRLLTQVAEALDAAHVKGLIHRDVKPQNVLVGAGDHAYLADFGLTKGSDDAAMTETGQFVGTIDYISPEQARGERATAASDVYALTAVLCECLTGQVPYVKATEERVLLAHLSEPPPRLTEVRSDLPAAMDDVVAAGMAKDPSQRPASAGELMLLARRALGALPEGAAPGASTDETRLRATAGSPTRAPRKAAGSDPGATRLAGTPTAARRGMFVPAVLAAAVLAAVVGLLLGGGSGSSSATFGNSASAGEVELSFPAGWQHLTNAPAIPGLTFSQPLALGNASTERLIAGQVSASGPALLPAAFTASLNGALPRPEPVRLGGGVQALRYSGLSVHGLSEPLTLYTVPTANGVVTIACLGATASAAATQCAQIAATLKLNGTTAFGLVPSATYAAALGRTFGALRSAISTAAAGLSSASSASAQAAAADQLAAAYSAASRALAGLSVSPAVKDVNANLARALTALGRGYAGLAVAARAGNDAAYAGAQRTIASARGETAKALAALGKAGYVVSA